MAKEVDKKANRERKHFLKEFKAELKKVIWPTTKQVANNTIAVITIVLITAVIVFALDLIFGAINTHGIDNIRKLVQSTNSSNTTIEDSQTNGTSENEVENTNTAEENKAPTDGENSVENSSVQE